MKIFVSAGEVSGDAILGAVLRSLLPRLVPAVPAGPAGSAEPPCPVSTEPVTRSLDSGASPPPVTLVGLGGSAAMALGLTPLLPLQSIAVSGVWDVLRRAPTLWRAYRAAQRLLKTSRPDLVLLVDYPGLNLRLAARARALGLPVLFVAPPQTWVYRRRDRRLHKSAQALRGCAVHTLFPFETGDFSATAARVSQGHFWVTPEPSSPAADHGGNLSVAVGIPAAARDSVWVRDWRGREREDILLCPGSRMPVIRRNLPVWLDALTALFPRAGRFQVLVPTGLSGQLEYLVRRARRGRYSEFVRFRENRDEAFARARLALSFPGTVTMDLALARTPAIIMAVVDPLTLALGRRALAGRRLALPNLLLQTELFPEWYGVATNLTTRVVSDLLDRLGQTEFSWPIVMERLHDRIGPGDGAEVAAESALQILVKAGKFPPSGA